MRVPVKLPWTTRRPASRAGLVIAAAMVLTGCGQGSPLASDPAGATTTSSSTSTATSTAEGTPATSSSSASASTTPTASGGATGSGLSQSVVITAPTEGEHLPAGPIGIVGTGTAFEGTLLWSITQADGTVVSDGFTTAGANGEVGDFAVQQQVQSGTCAPCAARVWAPDESGGEGSVPAGPETAATVEFYVD